MFLPPTNELPVSIISPEVDSPLKNGLLFSPKSNSSDWRNVLVLGKPELPFEISNIFREKSDWNTPADAEELLLTIKLFSQR